jgi:hypothetical protein
VHPSLAVIGRKEGRKAGRKEGIKGRKELKVGRN